MMRFWRRVFAPVTLEGDFNGMEAEKIRFAGTFFAVPACWCLGDEGWDDMFVGYYGFGCPVVDAVFSQRVSC